MNTPSRNTVKEFNFRGQKGDILRQKSLLAQSPQTPFRWHCSPCVLASGCPRLGSGTWERTAVSPTARETWAASVPRTQARSTRHCTTPLQEFPCLQAGAWTAPPPPLRHSCAFQTRARPLCIYSLSIQCQLATVCPSLGDTGQIERRPCLPGDTPEQHHTLTPDERRTGCPGSSEETVTNSVGRLNGEMDFGSCELSCSSK